MGHLVGNETDENGYAHLTITHEVTHRLFDRDVDTAHTLADVSHQSVHSGVLEGMVELGALSYCRVEPERHGADPFPVAIMSEIDGAILATPARVNDRFDLLELHAAPHLVGADGKELDGLDQDVAEIVVEILLDLPKLGFALVGEAGSEVAAHDVPTISHHAIDEQIKHVGPEVVPPHREERYGVERREDDVV